MKTYQTIVVALCALFVFGCSQMTQTKSPTEVLNALNEASKTKDVAGIKNSVSRGTLKMIEESAKAQKMTVDELLGKENGAPFKDLPEMRNEKIEGDTATVELKNAANNDWESVPFVKEDGVWRLALDKYLEDFRRKATQSMKMPPTVEGDDESNAPQSDADKAAKEEKPAKSKK